MKQYLFVLMFIILSICYSCASVQYEKADGTKISYTRFLTTNDSLDVEVGDSKAKVNGQKIDAEALAKFINMIGAVK